jgi:hypothetical protein
MNLIMLRITRNLHPFVGEDLRIYGPFYREDIVNIPEKNARPILDELAGVIINAQS